MKHKTNARRQTFKNNFEFGRLMKSFDYIQDDSNIDNDEETLG